MSAKREAGRPQLPPLPPLPSPPLSLSHIDPPSPVPRRWEKGLSPSPLHRWSGKSGGRISQGNNFRPFRQ